jgi:N-acetylglucosamine-6-phosphate deacetylase
MIILSGADVVLSDRILSPGTLVIEGDRITEVMPSAFGPANADVIDLHGHYLLPGFIDVHVHGLEGADSLDGSEGVARTAARQPRYGVTAFCPTTIACPPPRLRTMLAAVRAARLEPEAGSARVLPAHLESNFLNAEYRGAQPLECLRLPLSGDDATRRNRNGTPGCAYEDRAPGDFSGEDILAEIERCAADVGVVTLAPELDGATALIEQLVSKGHQVSLGHSAATFEQAMVGIAAGARRATHLFNRMPPLGHRAPGLAGALLHSEDVVVEVICDAYHVHPAMLRLTVATKGPAGVMAVTDGTSGSGLPPGSRTPLGGRTITITGDAAFLEDGTLAGSTATMDKAFRVLVNAAGISLVDAAALCSTTPARTLGLTGCGVIAQGALADLVVMDRAFRVVRTFVGGTPAYCLE